MFGSIDSDRHAPPWARSPASTPSLESLPKRLQRSVEAVLRPQFAKANAWEQLHVRCPERTTCLRFCSYSVSPLRHPTLSAHHSPFVCGAVPRQASTRAANLPWPFSTSALFCGAQHTACLCFRCAIRRRAGSKRPHGHSTRPRPNKLAVDFSISFFTHARFVREKLYRKGNSSVSVRVLIYGNQPLNPNHSFPARFGDCGWPKHAGTL